VSGHSNELTNLEHDISVNSEVSRDVLVDVSEMLSLLVNSFAEIAAFNARNVAVHVVGFGLGVVVSATLRHGKSVLLLQFLVLALVVRRSSLEYKDAHGLVGRLVSSVKLSGEGSVIIVKSQPSFVSLAFSLL